MRTLIIILAITHHAPARAEQGRFPLVEVGTAVGLGSTPIPYTTAGGTEDTRDELGAVFGPALRVHLDATRFLINLEGVYNVVWLATHSITPGANWGCW
jgi:hypothetical protein